MTEKRRNAETLKRRNAETSQRPDAMADDDDHGLCPKRVWTLSVLSEDEPLAGEEALPWGLRFHLSRCPSCRDLAHRLLAVNGGLTALASGAMDGSLVERANERAAAAIEAGLRPQRSSLLSAGNAEWPDDLLVSAIERRANWWRPALRYAAAAVIVGALIFAGQFAGRHSGDGGLLVDDRGVVQPPRTEDLPESPAMAPTPSDNRVALVGPPDSAAPGSDLATDPSATDEVGRRKLGVFQRAWVPGRDYGRAFGHAIDNGESKKSNSTLRDEP